MLAEILEPIMGKGLIPADLETWKPRRRAIVPAFHKAYLEAMVGMFGACTQETIRTLEAATAGGGEVRVLVCPVLTPYPCCCRKQGRSCTQFPIPLSPLTLLRPASGIYTCSSGLSGCRAGSMRRQRGLPRVLLHEQCMHVAAQGQVDMEEVFLSLGLDIIGLGVFNYDFKSITKESPVIKASAL